MAFLLLCCLLAVLSSFVWYCWGFSLCSLILGCCFISVFVDMVFVECGFG